MGTGINQTLNPLNKFDELINDGGIEKCLESYISDMKQNSGTPTKGENFEFIFASDATEHGGETIVKTVTFGDRLNKVLKQAYLDARKKIDETILMQDTLEPKQHYLISVLDFISQLLGETDIIDTYNNKELIKGSLNKLIKYIKDRYKSVGVNHSLITNMVGKVKLPPRGYFKFKGNEDDEESLYKTLITLEFLSRHPDEKIRFKNIINSTDPKMLTTPIIVECDAEKASYIFFKMESLFKQFTYTKIEDSNVFLTSKKKPFIKGNMYTAKSRFLDGDIDEIAKVNQLFDNLIKPKM